MKTTLATAILSLAVTLLGACLDASDDGNLVPRTADADPSLPQLSFNGSTFHLQTFGDEQAPVIVMLHRGPGTDHRSLLRLRNPVDGRRLEDDHRLIFWDQRGAGLSQRHDEEDLTLDAYDADLDRLIDHFSPQQPVVLIGHSWGGMYAAQYIARHPEKVAGAVLLEPGPLTGARYEKIAGEVRHFAPFSEWLNDFTWAQTVVSQQGHARADYLMMLGQLGDAQPGFHNSTTDRSPIWRIGAMASIALQNDGMVDGKPRWDFTRGLDRFAMKVLFEASADNTVIGEAFQREQMRDFANAELSVIADSGHDFPWTQAEATLRPIFTYLDETGL